MTSQLFVLPLLRCEATLREALTCVAMSTRTMGPRGPAGLGAWTWWYLAGTYSLNKHDLFKMIYMMLYGKNMLSCFF